MQPTKRSNRNNLILCGVPAKKAPEPPVSNDDFNKPSILKALEAVVAAGRRGLLGPAAMAAAEAMPDLDLQHGDGKVDQETPSSLPLVEEKNEEEKEEENVINKECNTVVTVKSPVKGTGSQKPTKKEIWICGNAVIALATMRAQFNCHGLRLGFAYSTAFVNWRGIPTMMWDDLLPILHQMYHQHHVPSIIVIHLGESDLLTDSSSSLVTKMQNDLGILQRALPDAVIIWSSLLPRHVWKSSEESSQVMESERNNVNYKMEEYCSKTGKCYLSHPLLTAENKWLFLPDGSLSLAGADIFITDLKKVLNTYLLHDQF
ncbi:uncharacterized protein LOC132569672 [Heteronotia binoei]|uniref:uncharacterized protein LOC132569672 n=1 Tax=Heteronotia binoei TaxID=13085 RepID=UPI00292F5CA4|nr:uncharacterized protein LOC132569672 [Heteronotia binoei]